MEIKIKPSDRNHFPVGGLFIKSPEAKTWVKELQEIGLSLEEIKIYPIPADTANVVWGCLVILNKAFSNTISVKHERAQQLSNNLYIGENCEIEPALLPSELSDFFSNSLYAFHPEFGLAELNEELDFTKLLVMPQLRSWFVNKPAETVFIPETIKSLQIIPLDDKAALKKMEEEVFPKREKMPDDSLSPLEKSKLFFYRALFSSSSKKDGTTENVSSKKNLLKRLESLIAKDGAKQPNWINKMQADFEDLEKRNQKQLDKLLEMLKNNPEEALKYAIPIDPNGSTRGGSAMELELGRRWNSFSLLGNSFSGGSGGTINLGDGTELLSRQYRETAQKLKEEGNYQKAAFVYMKLLKDYYSAASTLEEGGFYNEAAIIYKKHCYNDAKAAECYEKGNYTNEAIELYIKVNNFEKAGDLFSKLKKTKQANFYYEKTADEFIANNKYLNASEVYKNKMNDRQRAQEVLLSGWRNGRDSVNCLRLYLSEYQNKKHLMEKLNYLTKEELTAANSTSFLQAVKHFYAEKDEYAPKMKEMVYEIVAQHVNANIDLVNELKNFSKTDTHLAKDAIKYKLNRNRLR